jgi:hypothetical protein
LDKDKDKEDSEYEEGDEDCDDEEKEEEKREGEEKYNEEGEEKDNGVEDVTNSEEKTTMQRVVAKEGKYLFIPWIKTNPSPQLAHDQSVNFVVGLPPIVFQNNTCYVPCCTQCGKGFTWFTAPKHVCANWHPDSNYTTDSIPTHNMKDLSTSKKKRRRIDYITMFC